MIRPELQKKIDFAIKLLRSIPNDEPIEISYSGGKDSDVILQLAKEAGINYRAIYKCTSIDPPGTIKHAKEMGAEVIRPEKTFFQLIQERGLPSRFQRFCCTILKEYKVLDRAVHGIRRCESPKRAERYKEPEFCRTYSKKDNVRVYLPILEWADEDVAEFISDRTIVCAPVYYEGGGQFDVKKRLGCIGCPLACQSKRREQFSQYPKMLRLWIKNFQVYLDNHRDGKIYQNSQGNPYNRIFFELFCTSKQQCDDLLSGGLFPETAVDAKKFLEDYFKIDLTI